jgi:hypothetical protein
MGHGSPMKRPLKEGGRLVHLTESEERDETSLPLKGRR